MAIANSTQILVDSNKRTVIKRIGVIDSDESLTVIIDPRALSGALNANNLPYYSVILLLLVLLILRLLFQE